MSEEEIIKKIVRKVKEIFCRHRFLAYPAEDITAISCEKCGKTRFYKNKLTNE